MLTVMTPPGRAGSKAGRFTLDLQVLLAFVGIGEEGIYFRSGSPRPPLSCLMQAFILLLLLMLLVLLISKMMVNRNVMLHVMLVIISAERHVVVSLMDVFHVAIIAQVCLLLNVLLIQIMTLLVMVKGQMMGILIRRRVVVCIREVSLTAMWRETVQALGDSVQVDTFKYGNGKHIEIKS